jgi:hypothetical protein
VQLIKYFIEYDDTLVINKEFVAKQFPICIEWFAGNDLVLEPEGFQKIKVADNTIILRKGNIKKGKTDLVPFLFLESLRRGDYDRARRYITFDITDDGLKQYFGEFEILINNYLEREDVFSILPKGSGITKNFVFEILDTKIANISQL